MTLTRKKVNNKVILPIDVKDRIDLYGLNWSMDI